MSKLLSIEAFPFSLFNNSDQQPKPHSWLQNVREGGFGPSGRFCSDDRRAHIDFSRGSQFDPFCHAILDLMERDLGGHPDQFDPMNFGWIITNDMRSCNVFHGQAFVSGKARSGNREGICLQVSMPNYQSFVFSIFARKLILPIRTSQKYKWDVLDDEGFERLMFRLFIELDFDNVQWLQKTRAPDSGRDISAERVSNGNRVLIQARHQSASLTAPEVNEVVVKAETWNPKFDEVIVVTTSTFTQEAVRWVDNHNANPGQRPSVTLQPCGHLEVMLSRHPFLIAHLGLR